jgi:hypothetical protein
MGNQVYTVVVLVLLLLGTLYYFFGGNKAPEKKKLRDACFNTVLKIRKPVRGYYLGYDNKTVHLSKKPKTIELVPCNQGVKIKVADQYVTMCGYDSVYNTEYPVSLAKVNKPLFNSFKMKKTKKNHITFQTHNGYYLGFSFEKNTLIFSKDKTKRFLFRVRYL